LDGWGIVVAFVLDAIILPVAGRATVGGGVIRLGKWGLRVLSFPGVFDPLVGTAR
jgi:hypothetical protein